LADDSNLKMEAIYCSSLKVYQTKRCHNPGCPGEKRNAYRLLVRKPKGRRPLGRPRRRWVDNIRMDLGEVGWGDVDWIGLA
jgi:hypothetical protein